MKAKNCDECKFFHAPSELRPRASCAKGHKPRFYSPKNGNPYDFDWGWKRRCNDFEQEKTNGH